VTNRVVVVGREGDPEVGDNALAVVGEVKPDADLALTVGATDGEVLLGEAWGYELGVTNLGPQEARAVLVECRLGEGLEYVGAEGSQGTWGNAGTAIRWEVRDLAAGSNAVLRLSVRGGRLGPIASIIALTGNVIDPDPGNNFAMPVIVVRPAASFSVTQSVSADPVLVNDPLEYRLQLTNLSTYDVPDLRLVDALPLGAELISVSTSYGTATYQNGTVTCDLGGLPRDTTVTVHILTRPTVVGPALNRVTLKSRFTEPTASELTHELSSRVVDAPPLAGERSGNKWILSWSRSASDYALETTDTLSPGAVWYEDRSPRVLADDRVIVTVKLFGDSRFYRLRKP
jgi:uncharacterized repeat protein (TIGR01451 family)